jgi:hypothetical protein
MRILVTLALITIALLVLTAVKAQATPIRPDIRKIVDQPQQDSTAQFMPARAGWDGPEMASGRSPAVNPSLEAMAGSGLARARRAELITAATPDPRAILAIAALIFLLRLLKKQDEKRASATVHTIPLENNQGIAA